MVAARVVHADDVAAVALVPYERVMTAVYSTIWIGRNSQQKRGVALESRAVDHRGKFQPRSLLTRFERSLTDEPEVLGLVGLSWPLPVARCDERKRTASTTDDEV
jgi:hypothetical protein